MTNRATRGGKVFKSDGSSIDLADKILEAGEVLTAIETSSLQGTENLTEIVETSGEISDSVGVIETILSQAQDFYGKALSIIDFEHHKVHEGQAFRRLEEVNLSGTTPYYCLLETSDPVIHFKEMDISTEKSNVKIEIFRAPTVSNKGTPQDGTIPCNDSVAPQANGMVWYCGSVVSAEGAPKDEYYMPGGETQPNRFVGGSGGSAWETVLAPNESYLFKFQRLSGTGECRVLAKMYFYIQGPRP